MDPWVNKEHAAVRRTAREFAENELEPIALEWERRGEFPEFVFEQLVEQDMRGFRVPVELGGNDMDKLAHVLVVEEFSKVWPSAGFELNEPVIRHIRLTGSAEQRERYLPELCAGALGATAYSEPDHGSDLAAIETTADRTDEGYVLNGTKMWSTGAGDAEYFVVSAKTDPGAGHRGISMFVVEREFDGIHVEPALDLMVHHACRSHEVRFEDCVVPADNLLGEENRGFYQAMEYLAESRLQAAVRALGIAAGAFDDAVAYAQDREAFGQPIGEFQAIRHKLAEMAMKIQAARHLVYHAAWLCDREESFSHEAALAKLFASRTAREVSNQAVQIHGAYGVANDFPVSMFYRDAKATEIYDGTNEIQKNIIASTILD